MPNGRRGRPANGAGSRLWPRCLRGGHEAAGTSERPPDMVELGRKDGLTTPQTEVRNAVEEDDDVREQAKDVIKRGMADAPKRDEDDVGISALCVLFPCRCPAV